jgi:hypothetical protein
MSKDVPELEHRSPREYGPEPRKPLETHSVPTLKEVEEGSVSAPRPKGLRLFAAPETVVADRELRATAVEHVGYKIFVFQHGKRGFVPARIAAVVPDGLTEFTRALIFFHPLPTKKAGFDDAQYQAQTGRWHNIYRYLDQQGVQLAASTRKMVLIFPIFNLASVDTCGEFPAEWKNLVELIMKLIRNSRFPGLAKDKGPVVQDVITASYSAGVKYMHTFLTKATNIKAHLREVWDYDGRFSSHKDLSEGLRAFGAAKVLTYDQRPVKMTDVVKEARAGKGIHIPEIRWRDLPNKRTSFLDFPTDTNIEVIGGGSLQVHGAFPRFIMFHSLSESSVDK